MFLDVFLDVFMLCGICGYCVVFSKHCVVFSTFCVGKLISFVIDSITSILLV